MNFISTLKGSLLEGFFPGGWDLERIDECAGSNPETILERQDFWNKDFEPVPCEKKPVPCDRSSPGSGQIGEISCL